MTFLLVFALASFFGFASSDSLQVRPVYKNAISLTPIRFFLVYHSGPEFTYTRFIGKKFAIQAKTAYLSHAYTLMTPEKGLKIGAETKYYFKSKIGSMPWYASADIDYLNSQYSGSALILSGTKYQETVTYNLNRRRTALTFKIGHEIRHNRLLVDIFGGFGFGYFLNDFSKISEDNLSIIQQEFIALKDPYSILPTPGILLEKVLVLNIKVGYLFN